LALKKIPEKACVEAHKLTKLNQYRDGGSTKLVQDGQREVRTGRESALGKVQDGQQSPTAGMKTAPSNDGAVCG
jgi:hypothetical protein